MASDPSYPDSAVARLIRNARIRKGMSHARLGAVLDRTATTIRRWERGEVPPPEADLAQLAEVLEVDHQALLHALHGPDPQVVVPAPQAVTADVPDDDDTSVSGGESSVEIEPRQIRPGIALVQEDQASGGEVAVVPGDEEQEPSQPWIDVSGEQITAPSPVKRPAPAPAKAPPVQPATAVATGISQQTEKVERVAPPAQAVAVVPQMGWRQLPSYVEDPQERWRYVLRIILTIVALAIMAYILLWATGEFLGLFDEVFQDTFSDPGEGTTSTSLVPLP